MSEVALYHSSRGIVGKQGLQTDQTAEPRGGVQQIKEMVGWRQILWNTTSSPSEGS